MSVDEDGRNSPIRFPPKPGCVRLPLAAADLSTYSEIIDTRSPSEWMLDHLPGALSYPVLDDNERARVGTLYKQASGFEAKKWVPLSWHAISPGILRRRSATNQKLAPLNLLLAGGSRSGALTHILRQIGWDATQLEGGYKRWRTQVVSDLQTLPTTFSFTAICGRTGSGKSRLLAGMHDQGAQVLDLEALAGHKGSVLGDIPNQPQPSQKMFESKIWVELSRFDPSRPVFVEAESKKIGVLRIPDALIESMWQGTCIELATPKDLRVQLLVGEYAHLIADPALMHFKIDCLKALHPRERIDSWHGLVDAGQWEDLVGDLLDSHYDPAYDRSMFKNYVGIGVANSVALPGISATGFLDAALATISTAAISRSTSLS